MPHVIASLQRDHANIAKLLELIESEMLAIEVGKTPDYPLMQDIMRYMVQYSDRFHHPKEDMVFAQLLKHEPGVRAEVEELIEEHVLIRLAGQEFYKFLYESSVDSVDLREQLGASGFAYIRSLREHMTKEEKTLFPAAVAALTKKEWQVVDAAVDSIDDPLFDDMTADDYHRLYRLILE